MSLLVFGSHTCFHAAFRGYTSSELRVLFKIAKKYKRLNILSMYQEISVCVCGCVNTDSVSVKQFVNTIIYQGL